MWKKVVLSTVLFFAFILVVGTATGNAFTTWIFEKGCVIPYATYNGSGIDTVVGITIAMPVTNNAIYWSFYNANGVPLMSNLIPITTAHGEYSFSLAASAAGAHQGEVGWLLITWDNDGVLNAGEAAANMVASAFLINLTNKDAAYLPVVPLAVADYDLAAPINLLNPPNSPIVSMTHGQTLSASLISRFLVSASGDPHTTLVIFTPLDAPLQFNADALSTTGAIQAGLTLTTTSHKLNVFDVEEIAPPGFTEGALAVDNPAVIGIQFSLIFWSVVGAEQTIGAAQF